MTFDKKECKNRFGGVSSGKMLSRMYSLFSLTHSFFGAVGFGCLGGGGLQGVTYKSGFTHDNRGALSAVVKRCFSPICTITILWN